MSNGSRFENFFSGHAGNFASHIDASIPAYRNVQHAIMSAIAQRIEENDKELFILDIGGSDADKGKLLAQMTRKSFHYICVDPNPAMYNEFVRTNRDYRLNYINNCFGDFTFDHYNGYTPSTQPDFIISSMVWQFLDNNRTAHYDAIRQISGNHTVFITYEKFLSIYENEYTENETRKDDYKLRFFNQAELDAKKETVLVGMTDNMVTYDDAHHALIRRFEHVHKLFDTGNFIPFISGDNTEMTISFAVNSHTELKNNGGLSLLHGIYG